MSKAKKTKEKNFFNKILEPLFESIEENTGEVLKKLTNFTFLRSTIKRYIVFFMFSTAALIIIIHGLTLLINTYIPALQTWTIYLTLGATTFLIGWTYLKRK